MSANLGTGEILVILIVALLIVGPERLPKLAKAFGKAVAGFKTYMNDVTEDFKGVSTEFKDVTDSITDIQKDVQKTLKGAMDDVDDTVKSVDKDLKKAGRDVDKSIDKTVHNPAKAQGSTGTASKTKDDENTPGDTHEKISADEPKPSETLPAEQPEEQTDDHSEE